LLRGLWTYFPGILKQEDVIAIYWDVLVLVSSTGTTVTHNYFPWFAAQYQIQAQVKTKPKRMKKRKETKLFYCVLLFII
jgi:hypothetical protein